MTPIPIPAEALEAAARLLCHERHPCWSIVSEIFETDHDGQATEFRAVARAAAQALLSAWPQMSQHDDDVLGPACIILPLPQEASDVAV